MLQVFKNILKRFSALINKKRMCLAHFLATQVINNCLEEYLKHFQRKYLDLEVQLFKADFLVTCYKPPQYLLYFSGCLC